MLTIAQAAALLQAIIWMVVLSHGGWGFIAAPMAVVAAVLAERRPWASVALLLIPVVWLTISWAPILRDAPKAAAPWLLLVGPAVVSSVFIILNARRTRS